MLIKLKLPLTHMVVQKLEFSDISEKIDRIYLAFFKVY